MVEERPGPQPEPLDEDPAPDQAWLQRLESHFASERLLDSRLDNGDALGAPKRSSTVVVSMPRILQVPQGPATRIGATGGESVVLAWLVARTRSCARARHMDGYEVSGRHLGAGSV